MMKPREAGTRTVQLLVELYGELAQGLFASPHDADRLILQVTRYADELMRGLAIPATASVSLSLPTVGPRDELRQCEVLIDDQACRQPFSWHADSTDPVASLRRHIEQVICDNRELLTSSTQAEALYEAWMPSDVSQGDHAESHLWFHALLVESTRWGVSWHQARAWLQTHSQRQTEPRAPELCLEELAVMGDPLQVRICLPKGLQRAADASRLTELSYAISTQLETELGIDAGRIVFESRDECGGESDDAESRISINSLLLGATAIPQREPLAAASEGPPGPSDAEHITNIILNELRRHAGLLVTAQHLGARLKALGLRFPVLVAEAERRFDLLTLTAVLRAIVDEGVSLRNLRGILDCLTTINGIGYADYNRHIVFHPNTANFCPASLDSRVEDLSIRGLVETARMALKRYISHKYSASEAFDRESSDGVIAGNPTMSVLLLDPDLEERFIDSADDPFSAKDIKKLHHDIYQELRVWPEQNLPVLLTTVDIRHRVRQAIEKEFLHLAVVSYQELSPDLNIKAVARVGGAF